MEREKLSKKMPIFILAVKKIRLFFGDAFGNALQYTAKHAQKYNCVIFVQGTKIGSSLPVVSMFGV